MVGPLYDLGVWNENTKHPEEFVKTAHPTYI